MTGRGLVVRLASIRRFTSSWTIPHGARGSPSPRRRPLALPRKELAALRARLSRIGGRWSRKSNPMLGLRGMRLSVGLR